jgi:hypothetical protein
MSRWLRRRKRAPPFAQNPLKFAVENREAVLGYLGSASVCFVSVGANRLRTPDPPHGFCRAGMIPDTTRGVLLLGISPVPWSHGP